MRSLVRLGVAITVAGVGAALAAVLLWPAARALARGGRSEPQSIDLRELDQRSVVYARDGSVQAVLHAEVNRAPNVPLDQVPPDVVKAVLDVEDAHFFEHGPVDLKSTLRAAFRNVEAGGVLQGGSTITQQLVKNALLVNPKRDANRKVKEAVLAARLEHHMTKQQILERYLNTVYFGDGAYGIQAAAEAYFGIDAARLDKGDAAFLAGMIRNPVGYDPVRFPDASRSRRDFAIDRMRAVGDVTPEEAEALKARPLPTPVDLLPKPDDYFVDQVVQELLKDPRLGETPGDRYHAIFEGGLSIHTTLDPRQQSAAQDKVRSILPDSHGRFTAALVAIDPTSGGVRALVGGPGFEQSKFNLVTDGIGRQPGSSFKPFTLVAALEQGYSPLDTVNGAVPCPIPNPGGTPNPYLPGNVEGEAPGVLTLTDAMVHSVNCAYAQAGYIVGLTKVADVAHRLGIRQARIDVVPAMPLGTEEVRPIEMASAYATLADEGMYHAPYFVDSVDDRDGHNVFKEHPKGERVIEPNIARLATQVLQQVVQRGTGTAAAVSGRQVAGKTGTAEEYHDAWFVGYTPQLATAVWMGSPAGEVSMFNVGGIRVYGGTYPARIWGAFMRDALAGQPLERFAQPNWSGIRAPRFLSIKNGRGTTSVTTTIYPARRRPSPTTSISSTATTPPTSKPSPPTTDKKHHGPPPTPPQQQGPSG